MQVRTIHANDILNFPDLIDSMHKLRTRVFAERLHWNLHIEGNREYDEYDNFQPTYILVVLSSGDVIGCTRMLPATGPTMLVRTFPQLLREGILPVHSGMIEASRFCVDTTMLSKQAMYSHQHTSVRSLHAATMTLFAGALEWSIANHYTEIVSASNVYLERILRRAGWPMRRLGEPLLIGGTMCIAVSLPVDRMYFERLRPLDYSSDLCHTNNA